VYQPGSGPFTVDLAAGEYHYEWFNPDAGAVVKTGTITSAGGSRTFKPPFSGHAVLFLADFEVMTPGDFDRDGDVDREDFRYFQACFSGPTVAVEPGCEESDLDSNGAVDHDDFSVFESCIGGLLANSQL